MTTNQQQNPEEVSAFKDSTHGEEPKTTATPKNKWLFLLGAIALFAGGITVWRSVSSSQQSSEEITSNRDYSLIVAR